MATTTTTQVPPVPRRPARRVRYAVADGYLVRTVERPGGRTYAHRCPLAAFDAVALAVADAPPGGTTMGDLARGLGLPDTQANVALEFLKDRGVAVRAGRRRTVPASACAYEDALVEYHAVRERPAG